MDKNLAALREVNFDWVMPVRSVWNDCGETDISTINREVRETIVFGLDDMLRAKNPLSPLGHVIIGAAGTGKTHLMAALRRAAVRRGAHFVLGDMTGVYDFWETVLLGYVMSLRQPISDGDSYCHTLLAALIDALSKANKSFAIVKQIAALNRDELKKKTDSLLGALARKYRMEVPEYQDTVRALVLFASEDFEIAGLAHSWLQGQEIDSEEAKKFNFRSCRKRSIEIVRALSWIMSLNESPTVLALDQLDAIVAQHGLLAGDGAAEDAGEEQKTALAIIQGIAGGLGDLQNVTTNTLVVVTCLDRTWEIIKKYAMTAATARFMPPMSLRLLADADGIGHLIRKRLAAAYEKHGIVPPYPTWPFRAECFETAVGLSPRHLLQLCDRHRRKCLLENRASELVTFGERPVTIEAEPETRHLAGIETVFAGLLNQIDIRRLLDEKNEDETPALLLAAACRCLVKENPLPDHTDAAIDTDFPGGKNYLPLHARLRLIDRDKNDRESHYCLRALLKTHHLAFKSRLKAAMTMSGIDRRLRFRRLVIVRHNDLPGGPKTKELVDKFRQAGGVFVKPNDRDLKTLWAVSQLEAQKHPDFDAWLLQKKPVSSLQLMKDARLCRDHGSVTDARLRAVDPPTENGEKYIAAVDGAEPVVAATREDGPAKKKRKPDGSARNKKSSTLPLGLRMLGDRARESVAIPVANLAKHTVILAGAGSGKTVLLRRIIEEAALLGVPSIVVDPANDLATLGEQWPVMPDGFSEADRVKAAEYHASTRAIVWTPGREKGNPLRLAPLPDLTQFVNDRDELDEAVSMSREALRGIAVKGASATADHKLGVLTAALDYFAREGGGDLKDLANLLKNLPVEAGGGIGNAAKFAGQMGDSILAAILTNPLLKDAGAPLDPGCLFGSGWKTDRTAISIVNLSGLPSLETQQQFVNQLAMTLFSWLKKNPAAGDRPLRGLLVMDEAKDFIPSKGASFCKGSLMRLVAQARKYGLGIVLATQMPREIENAVIGNCSTHFYGRTNSPAAIETIRDLIKNKGGTGQDVPTLSRGVFYGYSEEINGEKPSAPVKFMAPMCLSYHDKNPLAQNEIIKRAAACRAELESLR